MRLIVLSSECFISEENKLINSLFSEGLEIFHLRKPKASIEKMRDLISQIEPKYRNRIVLHPIAAESHHELVKEYGIKRLHFTEEGRSSFEREGEFIYSTSFHNIEDVKKEGNAFDYYFLSPTFDSISKKGYKGKQIKSPSDKAVALGGMRLERLSKAKDLSYKNIALLGAIWQKPEDAVERFVEINNQWNVLNE